MKDLRSRPIDLTSQKLESSRHSAHSANSGPGGFCQGADNSTQASCGNVRFQYLSVATNYSDAHVWASWDSWETKPVTTLGPEVLLLDAHYFELSRSGLQCLVLQVRLMCQCRILFHNATPSLRCRLQLDCGQKALSMLSLICMVHGKGISSYWMKSLYLSDFACWIRAACSASVALRWHGKPFEGHEPQQCHGRMHVWQMRAWLRGEWHHHRIWKL